MAHPLFLTHGPLAQLAGIWEGEKGDDIAPSDERGVEKISFENGWYLSR